MYHTRKVRRLNKLPSFFVVDHLVFRISTPSEYNVVARRLDSTLLVDIVIGVAALVSVQCRRWVPLVVFVRER